jgi:uncharacterized small protein (DUF1192 family)
MPIPPAFVAEVRAMSDADLAFHMSRDREYLRTGLSDVARAEAEERIALMTKEAERRKAMAE